MNVMVLFLFFERTSQNDRALSTVVLILIPCVIVSGPKHRRADQLHSVSLKRNAEEYDMIDFRTNTNNRSDYSFFSNLPSEPRKRLSIEKIYRTACSWTIP